MNDVRKITYEEWETEAKSLFGDVKPRFWKFVCSNCGHVQSGWEMMKMYPDKGDYIKNSVFMSCEGRLGGEGCDWSLGGLFQIHKTEVLSPETGRYVPVFEFYKKEL